MKLKLICLVALLALSMVVTIFLRVTPVHLSEEKAISNSLEDRDNQLAPTASERTAGEGQDSSTPTARADVQPLSASNTTEDADAESTRQPRGNPAAEKVRGTVISGVGPVKILDSKIERDGKQVQLVEAGGKYPFLRVEQDSEDRRPTIMSADHVLVQFDPNIELEEIEKSVETAGLKIRKKFHNPGLFALRSTKETTIDFVPETLKNLSKILPGAQTVEPDFMVFTQELPSTDGRLEYRSEQEGIIWDSLSALNSAVVDLPDSGELRSIGPTGGMMPNAGTESVRTITFDPPTFLGGSGSYSPYLEAQNVRFEHGSTGMYVQNAYNSGYPDNGGLYNRTPAGTVIKHSQNLAFTLHSVDLAEYSTVFTRVHNVTLTGKKLDGSTVTHSLSTDGVIDGTGPQVDFETFPLPSTFSNLQEVKLTSITGGPASIHIDNVQITVDGQEIPPPVPPTPPMVYDMTFDPPIHTIDDTIAIGGHFAPKSINFGNPIVRSLVGGMQNAVELKVGDGGFYPSSNYEQFRVALGEQSAGYRVEMDVYVDSLGPAIYSDSFSVLFDGPPVQRFDFEEDNRISTFQSGVSSRTLGTYQLKNIHRIRFDIDMENGRWTIYLDGNVILDNGPFNNSEDLDYFRVHFSDSSGGGGFAAVDNIRVWSFDPGEIGNPLGPRLSVSPAALSFPDTETDQSSLMSVRLANTGDEQVNITSVQSNSSVFSTTASVPIVLPAGSTYDLPLRFSPDMSGSHAGLITLQSNNSGSPTQQISVSGDGYGTGGFTLSDESFYVTPDANGDASRTLTLQNDGPTSISWTLAQDNGSIGNGVDTLPSDPYLPQLWGMRDPGVFGAGIAATEAWRLTTGSPHVVVGVIDTGIDHTHSDLAPNIWTNEDEIPGNGVDDDDNGYIDDVRGWDFYSNDSSPMDGHSHGTHVSGTIAARGDNNIGVVGVGWTTRLMAIKFLSDSGSGWTSDAIDSVDYATENGAHLTNNSWGGGGFSTLLEDAIERARDQDVAFVAAAGNSTTNNDLYPHYPSSYDTANIVSVASTTNTDGRSSFSNYGSTSVDLGAPGSSIYSTLPGNTYGSYSGTSMASPHVAGAMALILSQAPGLSYSELKSRILNSVDPIISLSGKCATGGRLNVLKALDGSESQWLTLSKTTGTLLPGSDDPVVLTFDADYAAQGQNSQMLLLTSNDSDRPEIAIPVVFDVVDLPENPLPVITNQPNDTTIDYGGYAALSVTATSTSGTLSYQWYRGSSGNTSTPVGSNSRSFYASNLIADAEFWVRVANDAASVDSRTVSVTLRPEAPADINATSDLFGDKVRVTWSHSQSSVEYQIFRGTSNNFSLSALVGNTADNFFHDDTAIAGTNYYYFVVGIDEDGDVSEYERYYGGENQGRRSATPMDGTFIPARNAVDLVFADNASNLYITTEGGYVENYDKNDRVISDSYRVGGEPQGIDIAPDDSFLLVANSLLAPTHNTVGLHRISTATGVVAALPFAKAPNETGTFDVVITSQSQAFLSTTIVGSGATPLRELNIDTESFATRSDFSGWGGPGVVREPSFLIRNWNRSSVSLLEGGLSSGPWVDYDTATNQFGDSVDSGYFQRWCAINTEGTLFAQSTYPTFRVYTASGGLVANPGTYASGLCFSPVVDRLYAANWQTNDIDVYDTQTWAKVDTIQVDHDFSWHYDHGEGTLKISNDGESLALITDDGIALFDISEDLVVPEIPENFTATDDSEDWITLTWDEVENANTYSIYRSTTNDPNSAIRIRSGLINTSFNDYNATVGTPLFYWIEAENQAGPSGLSAVDSGLRPLSVPIIQFQPVDLQIAPGNSASFSVSATSNAGSLDYEWYLGASGDTSTPLERPTPDLNLFDPSQDASYWVRVSNSAGWADSRTATLTMFVERPTGVSTHSSASGVRIGWRLVSGAEEYLIYRASVPFASSATQIAHTTGYEYFDTEPAPGTRQFYFVRARIASTLSDFSDPEYALRSFAAPNEVIATRSSLDDRIRLSWGNNESAVGYLVYRSEVSYGASNILVGELEAGSTFFDDFDTVAETDYYYSVRAIFPGDLQGEPSEWVHGKRATPATSPRPDGMIGKSPSGMLGDGIYNSSGAGQNAKVRSSKKKSPRIFLMIQNDGDQSDVVALAGSKGARNFKTSYYSTTGGRANVTAAIVTGSLQARLGVGGHTSYEIQTKRKGKNSKRKSKSKHRIVAYSSESPHFSDAVTAKVTSK